MSADGKVIIWSMKNKLAQPIISYSFNYANSSTPLGGTSLSFVNIHAGSSVQNKMMPSVDDYFIIGTEAGNVYKAVLQQSKFLDVNKLAKQGMFLTVFSF